MTMLFLPLFLCCFLITEVVFLPSDVSYVSHSIDLFPDGVNYLVKLESCQYRDDNAPSEKKLVFCHSSARN